MLSFLGTLNITFVMDHMHWDRGPAQGTCPE